MRYFFRIEYDGSRFGGWQIQPNTVTIQQKLQEAFSTVLRTPVKITGAGRTDAGVHARAQGAHFDYNKEIDPRTCTKSVNALLPSDIAVYNLCRVEDSFHARYSAFSRRYCYYFSSRKRPLFNKQVWIINCNIDWNRIEQNIRYLEGTHDFSSFRVSGYNNDNAVCTVNTVSFEQDNDNCIFTIEANRFIYKMVRSIVGTLIDIGREKCNSSLDNILALKDRRFAGMTAPPNGLVLENVQYREVLKYEEM